jgi:tetratricopeptide (TPR) repeat protein
VPSLRVHWRFSERFFHSFGELCLARGEADEALSFADECIELATHNGSMKVIVKGRRLRAESLIAQGRLEPAEEELDIALQLAQQVANPTQLWKTLAVLGQLRLAQERPKDACQLYRDALAVIDGVALNLTDESLRAGFLASDHVEAIRNAASG